jgi:hypothetical protein
MSDFWWGQTRHAGEMSDIFVKLFDLSLSPVLEVGQVWVRMGYFGLFRWVALPFAFLTEGVGSVGDVLENLEEAIGVSLDRGDDRLGFSLSGIPSWGTYTLYGTTTLEIEGNSVEIDLGTADNPGLQLRTQWAVAPRVDFFNGTVKETLSLGGLTIATGADGLSVSYNADSWDLDIWGEADIQFEDESLGVVFGSAADPGLVLQILEDGSVELESADIDLDASFELFGLQLATDPKNDLEFRYSKSDAQYEAHGGVQLTIEGQTIEGELGTPDAPGLIIDSGSLETLAIGVAADLEIAGFSFIVEESDPLDFRYTKAPDGDHFLVSGDVVLKDLWKVELALGTEQHPGLKIVDGIWDLESLKIDVEKIDLGFLSLKQVEVVYGREPDGSLDLDVDLKVVIPEIGELDAEVEVVGGQLHEIALDYQASGTSEGLEIAETGVSIAEIGAKVTNIDQPVDIGVDGTVGIEFGGQLDIAGTTVTLIRVNGEVSVDKNHFYMEDDFFLGAYKKSDPHSLWQGLLFDGTIVVDLNWQEDRYYFDGEVKVPEDYGLYFDAKLLIDSAVVDALITSEVRIPTSIPLFGGIKLESISAAVHLDNYNKSNDYAAAWTTFLAWTVGIEYLWNTGHFRLLDGNQVDQIESQIESDINNHTITKTFTVPAGATGLSITVDWGKEIDKEISFIFQGPTADSAGDLVYDILSIQPMSIDGSGVTLSEVLVDSLSSGSKTTVFVQKGSQGFPLQTSFARGTSDFLQKYRYAVVVPRSLGIGEDDIQLTVVGHYPNSTVGAPSVGAANASSSDRLRVVRGVSARAIQPMKLRAGSTQPINLNYWMLGKHAEDATISLYLDDNDSGYDGRLIASDIPYGLHDELDGGSLLHQWEVQGFVPKDHDQYFIYARLEHADRTPVFSPYSGPIRIQPPVYGTVFDSSEDNRPHPGMRVFLDTNTNGQFDPESDPSDLTNSAGQYAFHTVPTSDVMLGLIVPLGHALNGATTPESTRWISLADTLSTEENFDLHRKKTLAGTVFHDVDGDGIQGVGEDGIKGVVLYLDDNDNARRDPGELRAWTKRDGGYRFHDIATEVQHRVRIDIHASLFDILLVKSHTVTTDGDPLSDHEGFDFPIVLSALADVSNMDYIDWARSEFPYLPVGSADSLQTSDPDGDGTNNWVEFLIGTDPLDPQSNMPPMQGWVNAGAIELDIPVVPGPTFYLEQTSDFDVWTPVREIRVAEPQVVRVTLDPPDDAPLFFRLWLE